ncbi:MAG: protein-disulfide reductase DsbD domain-containing protein [Myxococcota bacterium]
MLRSILQGLGILLAGIAGAAPNVPPEALGTGAAGQDGPVVEARLLVDAEAVAPGEVVPVGVFFELENGWHMYWRNPGDSGLPTRLSWNVEGAELGPLRWPAPYVFKESEAALTTYAYADSVLLQHDALITAQPGRRVKLSVDADFLVCKRICIPGRISLERSVPVQERPLEADKETRALFADWDKRVPVPPETYGLTVDELYSQSAIRPGDNFKGAVALTCDPNGENAAACRGLKPHLGEIENRLVPDALESIEIDISGSRMHPFSDGVLITFEGRADDSAPPEEQRLRGVARVANGRGETLLVDIDLPLPRAETGSEIVALVNPWLEPEPEYLFSGGISLWQAFVLALLGGLILNLMPCVLPVLAIKVFGIAERAHADRRGLVLNGATYTLGILTTMAVLAAVVIGLRSVGTSVGWGFQFQEPLFVASISALLLAFALNLFGVFEIGTLGSNWLQPGTGSENAGLRRSFFEGLLAVLLATPCTAPFLGTAVGFAFASTAPVILVIFLAIGLGLAAPFVAITFVPGWARLLPRSGPWMIQLRAVLGFALLATLVWLLWVVGRQVGTEGVSLLLAFLLALAAGVWIYGGRQRASEDGRAPFAAAVLILLAGAALVWLPLEAGRSESRAESNEVEESDMRFDPESVAREVAAGRPAFVYFTADWCLTCKLNEGAVLADDRIQREMERLDVATFKADWTLRDERIRQELARFGRAGVPLYLLYDPRRPTRPHVLPELLTVDRVLDALGQIERPATGPT